jgi:hypothetical protein
VIKLAFPFCMFYTLPMPHHPQDGRDTFSLKLGSWFEAYATGSGVIAIVAVVLLLAAAAAIHIVVDFR